MKKYLYYPNFEPPNTIWLKFSLLYMERFESIVPYSRQHLISDDYRRVTEETDLAEMYSPTYEQGDRATIKAIDEVEGFLSNTYHRSSLFDRPNIRRDWKNPGKWNYQIYRDKYSNKLEDFCRTEEIGKDNNDGLLLPEELAFIFMSHLANEIAHEREGSIITDNNRFDNYTNYLRINNPQIIRRNKFIKGVFNLLLPADISTIPLDRLIRFRNERRDLISAFNNQIDILEESIRHGMKERDLINEFNNIYSELNREIILLGLGVASIPFAAYMLISSQEALLPEYTKEILGAVGAISGGIFSVRKALYDTKEKRMCKKYLTNLSRLKI